jgi:hypothetical protein
MTDSDQIVALIIGHKWLGLSAIAIALIVRLLKSDTKIPITVPPRWRLPLAFALGQLGAVLQHIADGTSWKNAIIGGLVSSALAVVGHDAIIMSARGGKEIPIPGLTDGSKPPTGESATGTARSQS